MTNNNMNRRRISAVLLSWKRPHNLLPITNQLRRSLPIGEVFWVNNNPLESLEVPEGVTLIEHSRDLGLWSRFSTAALASNNDILLHDDDVMVNANDLGRMWQMAASVSGRNVGLHGRNCGQRYDVKNVSGNCEVLLTHCVLTTKERCLAALSKAHEFDQTFPNANPRGNGEDILLSFTGANYAYPAEVKWRAQKDHAICRRNGHSDHRTKVLQWCRSLNRRDHRFCRFEAQDDSLVIEPRGGLGNRLRVIFYWLEKAKSKQKKLKVVWHTHKNCTDNFSNHFVVPNGVQFYEAPLDNQGEAIEQLRRTRKFDYNGFGQKYQELVNFDELRLLPSLARKKDEISARLGNEFVAVHVRRTDRIVVMREPERKFTSIREYYRFIDDSGIEKIFLATDSHKIQQRFKKRYGDRVCWIRDLEQQGQRRESEMDHAILDLYVSKNATNFFGTEDSSFTASIEILRGERHAVSN